MSSFQSPPPLRYFLTYRGRTLPLNLVEELAPEALQHRNTYFRAGYSEAGRIDWVEKLVYGDMELRHDYVWGDDGALRRASICMQDEEPRVLQFGPDNTVEV